MTVIDLFSGQPVTNVVEREAAQLAKSVVPATRLTQGSTVENGTLRIHRYRDVLVLWDLTHAGKRGRQVGKVSLSPSYTMTAAQRAVLLEQLAELLETMPSFDLAVSLITKMVSVSNLLDVSRIEQRGVDVAPAGHQTIVIETAAFTLSASYLEFSVRCRKDKGNEPTVCQPSKNARKVVQNFYAWVSGNQDRIKAMSYQDVLSAMSEQGIEYHSFCSMA